MRFFHISDLHIGKQLHRYSLKEDQTAILKEIVSYAKEFQPDAVIIAGDIYDKSVPSGEAVIIFDEFLTDLSMLSPTISVFIISGNHDNAQRLQYASSFLEKHHIYVVSTVPEREGEYLEKVSFRDEYGQVNVYLLPFLKPSFVRGIWPDNPPESYDEAVKRLLEREVLNQTQRNILVSHQFYTNNGKGPDTCDSETISVGGIDNIDASHLKTFDYVALGHIHGAQSVGAPYIRYCGTPLKYSVSESGHEKTLTMVDLSEKGTHAKITALTLHPIRDVKKKRGQLTEILLQATAEEQDDYVSITLTDEIEPYKPKEQLEEVYRHILEVRIDNTRVRNKLAETEELVVLKSPFDAFCDFFKEVQGKDIREAECEIMHTIMDSLKGE